MSQPSPDARAVVRALDALTTQVRRLADGTATPVVRVTDDDPTTGEDAFHTLMDVPTPAPITIHLPGQPPLVGTWHGGGCGRPRESSELVWEPTITFPDRRPPMDPVHILGIDPGTSDGVATTHVRAIAHHIPAEAYQTWTEQAPAAEDALRIARRREAVLNLLNRLDRHDTLTREESALLRIHVADEGLEHDAARTEATRLGLMVDEYGKGASALSEKLRKAQRAADLLADSHQRAEAAYQTIDARTAERDQAQAAIERVRALADRWNLDAPPPGNRPLTDLRAALDGTEQPTKD